MPKQIHTNKKLKEMLSNRALLEAELRQREKNFPCKGFIPNVAQERFISNIATRHPKTDDFIKENHFIAGNGIGKTGLLAIILAGIAFGPAFLHPVWFGAIEFFLEMEKRRKERQLMGRIVCDAADVEETGSVKQNISKWIPLARFGGKVGGGKNYYTEIKIPNPDGGEPTIVNIKTHGQPLMAHAGPNLDFVLFNEPPPEPIYFENASRTRMGGYIFGFMTPLNAAPYLIKVIDAPGKEGKMSVTNGSIWDNCKDIPGNRGILTKNDVEDQIRRWTASDPIMAEARIYGKFMQLAGAVFKIWSPGIHVVDPFPIPPEWNVYMCVDPHMQKESFAVWAAVSPTNDWYVIAEYPTDPWDEQISTHLTIKDFIRNWKLLEDGRWSKFSYMKNVQISERFGDPNLFKCRQPINNRTLQQEYEWVSGWDFDVDIPDEIELRHDRIKDALKYDRLRPIDSMNRPHLYVFSSCENVSRAFSGYIYKQKTTGSNVLSEMLDETWICPMSALGYILVKVDGWQRNIAKNKSDYDDEYLDIIHAGSEYYNDMEPQYNGERWC